MTHESCKARVRSAMRNRLGEIRRLWTLYKNDPEARAPDGDCWIEYGLAFDYVRPGTFKDQKRGYFRFQISYGGPSEELRFYCDEMLRPYKIEFWFLDWFDGAKVTLSGHNLDLMLEIWSDWEETGSVKALLEKGTKE